METVLAPDTDPRPITFMTVHDIDGWKIKTYRMATVRAELVMAARRRAGDVLPPRPDRVGAYGVGFLIVHEAADACFALVDWWVHRDQLHQRVFAAPLDRPGLLEPSPTPVVGCVSALAVVAHERSAWLRHVLANPAGPNIDGYLSEVYR